MNGASDLLVTLGTIELLRPAWLLALLPLAVLLRRLAEAKFEASGWSSVVDADLLPLVTEPRPRTGRRVALGLLGAGLVAAVVALAGPALPGKTALAFRGDALRVLVVDLSPASAVTDGEHARIERVRLKLLDLLQAVPQGQTALIVYAEEPYLVAPPTTDAATIALLVPELSPDAIPLAGNRPERALRMAADLATRSGANWRDLVWLTADGEPSDDVAQRAAELVDRGIRLSVLDATRPEPTGAATTASAPPSSPSPILRRLAEGTGGLYLPLRAGGDDVRELVALLDGPVERTATARRTAAPRELGVWLLPLLLPLAALVFRRGVLIAVAMPLLLVPPPADAGGVAELWRHPDQQARRLLQAGEPDRAAELFTDARWRAVALYRAARYGEVVALLAPFDDPDSHYNRGNALARLGRLDDALAAFDTALRMRPRDADILHNRDLVRELVERNDDTEESGSPGGNGSEQDPDASPPPEKPENSTAVASADPASRPDGQGGSLRRGRGELPKNPLPTSEAPDAAGGSGPGGGFPPRAQPKTEPPLDGLESSERDRRAGSEAAPGHSGGAGAGRADSRANGRPLPHGGSDPQREADLLAEQWLRRVPDEPGGLLRRKLLLEHQRRESGEVRRPWQ